MNKVKVFAINVENNTYRREKILSQQEICGYAIEIFKAITPQGIERQSEKYNSKKARRFTGCDLLPTEIACSLSHLQLWKKLINDPENDYYIILEDDITFTGNIADITAGITKNTHVKIDFLKFSGQHNRPNKHIARINQDYCLHKFAYGPLDAAAYMLSKDGARKLYNYCKEMHSPIDILMDRTYSHGVGVYCVQPYPASSKWCMEEGDPLYSDIGPRVYKYAPDILLLEKTMFKLQRLYGSLLKRIYAVKLYEAETKDKCTLTGG